MTASPCVPATSSSGRTSPTAPMSGTSWRSSTFPRTRRVPTTTWPGPFPLLYNLDGPRGGGSGDPAQCHDPGHRSGVHPRPGPGGGPGRPSPGGPCATKRRRMALQARWELGDGPSRSTRPTGRPWRGRGRLRSRKPGSFPWRTSPRTRWRPGRSAGDSRSPGVAEGGGRTPAPAPDAPSDRPPPHLAEHAGRRLHPLRASIRWRSPTPISRGSPPGRALRSRFDVILFPDQGRSASARQIFEGLDPGRAAPLGAPSRPPEPGPASRPPRT
jgi:hypothetical protein